MFGVLDLVTVSIIEKKLEWLSKRPDHLEFILCGYHGNKSLVELVGPRYIKQAIEYITNSKMWVFPYYNLDAKKRPCISVIASGDESQQYIGDHGYTQVSDKQTVKSQPIVIAEFTAKTINGTMMTVPPELELDKKLWPGIIITNGTHSVVVDGIVDAGTLCFKTDLPDGLSPYGWKAQTAGSNRIYEINSSTDEVTVQCKLTTHGEPGDHRLLGLVLRYVLKSSRLNFDKIGFQNTRVSYSPMIVTDQEELEYESVYTIRGVFTDHWIYRDSQGPDSASNIDICTTAENPAPEKGDVQL